MRDRGMPNKDYTQKIDRKLDISDIIALFSVVQYIFFTEKGTYIVVLLAKSQLPPERDEMNAI